MIKFFCDKCGKELLWYENLTINNSYANISTMAQRFNTDGFKTYDTSSNQWLDLCFECKQNYNNLSQTIRV